MAIGWTRLNGEQHMYFRVFCEGVHLLAITDLANVEASQRDKMIILKQRAINLFIYVQELGFDGFMSE